MKEITIKLYTFDELSDEAKKRAHETFLSTGDYWGASDDAMATIKKVEELFCIKLSDWDIDSCNPRYPTVTFEDSRWYNDALDLKGNRARAYLWNNFGKVLLTGRYYSKWHGTKYAHSRLFFDRVYDGTLSLDGRLLRLRRPGSYGLLLLWRRLERREAGPVGPLASRRQRGDCEKCHPGLRLFYV